MELLGDTIIVLASQVVFFLVGWIFFVKMLFRDYELHHILGNLEWSRGILDLIGKCFSSVDILCKLHPFLHNVWTHYFRNCELPRQEFKVKTDRFVIHKTSSLIVKVFSLVFCHLLYAVHGDRPDAFLHHLLHTFLKVNTVSLIRTCNLTDINF